MCRSLLPVGTTVLIRFVSSEPLSLFAYTPGNYPVFTLGDCTQGIIRPCLASSSAVRCCLPSAVLQGSTRNPYCTLCTRYFVRTVSFSSHLRRSFPYTIRLRSLHVIAFEPYFYSFSIRSNASIVAPGANLTDCAMSP